VLTEVVITGSRIPQPNLTSASPIQVVNDISQRINTLTDRPRRLRRER